MTRSVEELRRESERNRTELAATVDRLKQGITETTGDLRKMVSPQHIKSELSGYVSHKARGWTEGLKQQAMDNPLRAVAAGAAVALPLIRLGRGVPLPFLMVAAGLALSSKTLRDTAADAAKTMTDKAGQLIDQGVASADAVRSSGQEQFAASQKRAANVSQEVTDAVKAAADDFRTQATEAAGTISSQIAGGVDAVKDSVAAAPEQARQIIGDNAVLIGGLGIAVGAIIAAALPATKIESQTLGEASDRMKQATGEAVQSGLEATKAATLSAADAATNSIGEADLGSHASRMTRNVADVLKDAATDVVDAALSPSKQSDI
jgi:hypothetical protein